jgi:predicted transcriptional regulator
MVRSAIQSILPHSSHRYSPSDFRLKTPAVGTLEANATRPRKLGESRTQSEANWKWVVGQLRAGNPAHEVVRILAASRRDKPNPIYYAQRTVDVASAVILARDGIDSDSIVDRLAERGSSRPSEIAATALRFVERLRIHHLRRTKMPLLEITQSRQISASVRLDEATATQVDQYAAFIRASADDVVDKALNYVFAKDRDFQDFLKTPEAKQISSTLRVRKAPSSEVIEQTTKKAVSAPTSVEPVRVVKA